MSEKMHKIEALGNRKFSDATIAEALKKHCEGVGKPRWLVARETSDDPRTILHLAELSPDTKVALVKAIQKNKNWISFCDNGDYGSEGLQDNGLRFYNEEKTEILVPL